MLLYESPIGHMIMEAQDDVLTGLWFADAECVPGTSLENEKTAAVYRQTIKWLDAYFQKRALPPMPKLKTSGTAFQEEVWALLSEIRYGKTVTYGEIAAKIAKKRGIGQMSAQAVGGAVGKNPIAIMIPCHRVVGTNGKLVGYDGGLDKKAALLTIEGIEYRK